MASRSGSDTRRKAIDRSVFVAAKFGTQAIGTQAATKAEYCSSVSLPQHLHLCRRYERLGA